jgi:hypothetical protein
MRISLTGDKAIDDILRNLPDAVSHRTMGDAHYKAAQPFVETEKLTAPEGPTGNLVDSIGAVKLSQKRSTEAGEVHVGPRAGGKYKGGHAIIVTKGTKRRQNRRGANRGVMRPNSYIQKAFIQRQSQVVGNISQEVAKSLLRTMRRYNRS